MRVLWESGVRIGDLMDFHWLDMRHICPKWTDELHPTIVTPSSQKNGRIQEVPMLPGLVEALNAIPMASRDGWIVNPEPIEYEIKTGAMWFRPTDADLRALVLKFSNVSSAKALGVSDTTVRKWLDRADIRRGSEFKHRTGTISKDQVKGIRKRAEQHKNSRGQRQTERLTKGRVSRVISAIGEEAGVVVRQEDERTNQRLKYASAHDLRHGCAQRLSNAGVSAEMLKVVMRHKDFATTEKFYGAMRSAQSAGAEVQAKLVPSDTNPPLVGGTKEAPQLSAEELLKLKSLLESL